MGPKGFCFLGLFFVFFFFGFPNGSDGKESILQCRKPGFAPWFMKVPWRREWLPSPVHLPGEFHGQRSLVGYSPLGHSQVTKCCKYFGFPGRTAVKKLSANARNTRDADSILGLERSPGEWNGNTFQYSCLESSMDRGGWWAASPWSHKRAGHDWASTHTKNCSLISETWDKCFVWQNIDIVLYAKYVNLKILMWRDYLELSGWAIYIVTSIYVRGRQREILLLEKMMWYKQGERFEESMLLTFKMKEVAIN